MSTNHAANDDDLVRRWCVADKNLAVKSCLELSADLLSEKLVNMMPEFKPRSTELWLIFPSRQSITPAGVYSETLSEKRTLIFLINLLKSFFRR